MTVSTEGMSRTTLKIFRRYEQTRQALATVPRAKKPVVDLRLRNLKRELKGRDVTVQ